MERKILKKFDRYILLDHLADGGMAEICRAISIGTEGAGRIVIIKCLLPSFGNDPEFAAMFKSEMMLALGLNHPNIIQVYDIGEVQERPFIAMEYVEGRSIRQLSKLFRDINQPFPIDLAVHIAEQAAIGLHYAHTFTERTTGHELDIVHRDVSPQNILVSFEGTVKLIDFGIAKAKSNLQKTQVGIIKGKPSYLSPEQIMGDTLDGRSDLFSLGIVLWELLTGKRLFAGENDTQILNLIQRADETVKAPSLINASVPHELDQIVMKALSMDRDARYPHADAFQRALHRFLYGFNPDFNPLPSGKSIRQLFKGEVEKDQKALLALTLEARQQLEDKTTTQLEQPFLNPERTTESTPTESTRNVRSHRYSTGSREIAAPSTGPAVPLTLEMPKAESRPRPQTWQAGAGLAQADQVRLARPGGSSRPSAASAKKAKRGGFPKFLVFTALVGGGIYFYPELESLKDSVPFLASLTAPAPSATPAGLAAASPAPAVATLASPAAALAPVAATTPVSHAPPAAPAPRVAPRILRFNVNPSGGTLKLLVNERPIGADATGPAYRVTGAEPLRIEIEKPGYRKLTASIDPKQLTFDPDSVANFDAQLEPQRYGILNLSSTPGGEVTIRLPDGSTWWANTPVNGAKFPAGTYDALFVNKLLDLQKSVKLNVTAGRITRADVTLAPR